VDDKPNEQGASRLLETFGKTSTIHYTLIISDRFEAFNLCCISLFIEKIYLQAP
jgi:hypothetical protein